MIKISVRQGDKILKLCDSWEEAIAEGEKISGGSPKVTFTSPDREQNISLDIGWTDDSL